MRRLLLHRINSPPLTLSVFASFYGLFGKSDSEPATAKQLFLPEWVRHSMPPGILFFTLLCLYKYLFPKHSFSQNILWLTCLTVLAHCSEYLQYKLLLPGNIDTTRILFYQSAYIIAVALSFKTKRHSLFTV